MSATLKGVETFGGCSLVVKLQPSKLVMWVRFPSPAVFTRFTAEFAETAEKKNIKNELYDELIGDKSHWARAINLRKTEIRKKFSSFLKPPYLHLTICLCLSYSFGDNVL